MDEYVLKYDLSKLKIEEGSGLKITNQGLEVTRVLSDEEVEKLKLEFPTSIWTKFAPPTGNDIDPA